MSFFQRFFISTLHFFQTNKCHETYALNSIVMYMYKIKIDMDNLIYFNMYDIYTYHKTCTNLHVNTIGWIAMGDFK
jgi:hypothetical protein